MSIKHNIEIIRNKIIAAQNKSNYACKDIKIVCIAKTRSLEEIFQVLDSGISYIGENKVQEAQEKYSSLIKYCKEKKIVSNFHMVGHLQTNKVNKALEMFDLIHSVDSLKLAERINEASKQSNKNTGILLEVNTSNEASKYGVEVKEAIALLEKMVNLEHVTVRGLMTMAPIVEDREKTRKYFCQLRQLRDKINDKPIGSNIKMDFLSMGMSQDYEIAVEEGANLLRIGSAIFEGVN